MADPVPATPATPSPAPVSVSAPASSQPPAAVLPAAEPAPAPAFSAPAPIAPETAKPASPGEPAPQATTPEPPAPAPTLLEKFDKEKAEVEAAKTPPAAAATGATGPAKPAEAGKDPQVPAGATAAAAPPAPEPVEYKYTLPETIKMDDALKAEVHTAFDHFRANPAEGAQELVNLHDKQMRQFAEFMAQEQHRVFAETRQSWAKEVLSDPDIGGSGHQTAMGAIARMRDLLVPERDRPAFEQFLRVTGAGDHPQFLKLLHQAARYYDEPTLPPPNPRPPPGNGQRPNRRLRDIYDHPRSTADGRS